MANANPTKARQAKRRRRVQSVGNIYDVQSKLWQAVEAAAAIVDTAADDTIRLKAIHAVTQSSTAYTKLLEAAEFEARLKQLEDALGE